ncbi:MAG: hypothetical protein C0623_12770 [Desulfuromonas sp.]|nr:MAG: hypothetical protein C0623_12770 [Desulfuromonas sp.]
MVKIKSLLDTLVFATSLIGVLPVYFYLDLPTRVIFPIALILGIWCDRRNFYFLKARAATILSLLVFAVFAIQINKNYLVEPALNIAVLLLAVRLLTEKEGRHYLQVFLLSGFALAGSSLMTLSLAFLPLMVLLVTGIILGLVLLCFYSDDPRLALDRTGFMRLLRITLVIPAGALLLAVLFFFILPRTRSPLWNFLNPPGVAKVGFSEEVRPGSFASTVADDTVAFRVEAPPMDPNELYWRVTVLDELEGRVWRRAQHASSGSPTVIGGKKIGLNIFPVSGRSNALATLDPTASIHGQWTRRSTDATFRLHRKSKLPKNYYAIAYLNGRLKIDRDTKKSQYLGLPETVAPQARAAVARIDPQTAENRLTRIDALRDFFIAQQLVYATQNLPTGGDPVDTFLFESKRGYCEYFASAFAIMLREMGIPSRLVGGYLGGTYNELGGYYTVGERTAHVWVEALLEDDTWLRIDPNLYAVNAEGSLLARNSLRPSTWRQLVDAVDYFWTQAVISFDISRQFEMARSVGDSWRDWRREKPEQTLSVWLILIPAIPLIGWLLYKWKRQSTEEILIDRFSRIVRRQVGTEKIPAAASLSEMAKRLPGSRAKQFAQIYSAAIYRDRELSKEEIIRLKQLLREIEQEI